MANFVTTIHLITCALIVLVVLIQSGKGADISASFGGSSQTVFGSSGGANFFTKLTWSLAGIFVVTSLVLTLQANKRSELMRPVVAPGAPVSVPAAGGAPDAQTPPAAAPAAAAAPATGAEKVPNQTPEKK